MVHLSAMRTIRDPSAKDVFAIKRTISRTLRSRLKQRGVTLASLARDTGTSRTAIRRVLDASNTSITLYTIVRTARSLGYQVRLSLEPSIERIERVEAPAAAVPLMRDLGEALDRLRAR